MVAVVVVMVVVVVVVVVINNRKGWHELSRLNIVPAVQHLLASQNWNDAHELVASKLAPPAIIQGGRTMMGGGGGRKMIEFLMSYL